MTSKTSNWLRQWIQLLIYIGLQLIFDQAVIASSHVHAFIYMSIFLLMFEQRAQMPLQLILAFCGGLVIDAFHDTWGIHAAASVLAVYVKYGLSRMIAPTSQTAYIKPSLRQMDFKSFSVLIGIPLWMHHTAVLLLEAWNKNLFFLILRKSLFSSIVTYLVIIVVQAAGLLWSDHKSA